MSSVSQRCLQVWHSCHALNHSNIHTLEVWASYHALDNRLLRVKLVSQPQLTLQTHLWQKPRTEQRATKDTVMTQSSFLWLFLYFFPSIWSICLHILMPFSHFPLLSFLSRPFAPVISDKTTLVDMETCYGSTISEFCKCLANLFEIEESVTIVHFWGGRVWGLREKWVYNFGRCRRDS